MQEGDRVVEVNGQSTVQDNHQQVVQKIKMFDTETKILVVDPEADRYYRENSIVVNGNMAEIETIICPDEKPSGGQLL